MTFRKSAMILILALAAAAAEAKKDMPGFEESCRIIMENVTDDRLSKVGDIAKLDTEVEGFLVYYAEDGSFSDIDYNRKDKGNWQPIQHLERLDRMAAAYITQGSIFYKDKELYSKIVSMLRFWQDRNPRSDNWWYNQIGAPRLLALDLVLLRSGNQKIPDDLEKAILDRMARDGGDPRDENRTGANKADIAQHWLYRGCLLLDEKTVDIAVREAFYPARYTTGEGIQHDNSYFQHHEQFYVGGYSTVLMNRIAEIASYTTGTKYALNKEQLDILNSYIVGTFLTLTRGNTIAFNTMGRSISRPGALSQGSAIGWLKKMALVDRKRGWQYEDGVSTIYGKSKVPVILPQTFTHYYIGDYSIFRNDTWSFGVRMVSGRTWRSEELNGENTKGYFISDGSTSIMSTGQEYMNIFPVWDWNKVPGTTAPQKTVPSMYGVWTHPGESGFTGGVSDGKTGVSVYTMDNHEDSVDIAADKAWFFFGNEVVCLGCGISSSMDEEIATTVNQCLAKGSATYSSGGTEHVLNSGHGFENIPVDWIIHDNIGYLFPLPQKVSAKIEKRSGSWKDINSNQSGNVVESEVFTAWLGHGTRPAGESYSYIVIPAMTSSKIKGYDRSQISIIENSCMIQAVSHTGLKMDMFVFHKPGEASSCTMTVSADSPCIVMVDRKSGMLHVSDPSHSLDRMSVSIRIKNKELEKYEFDLSGDGLKRGITHSMKL